ncbi:hypothetical protein [Propionibacterium freudenreichii]|uniref:hypothetical protein n=1 Tax=Propionibacterium freudenreichii TaxID=1744 RepID=UPI0021A49CFA|nr:hypothetical protein [Propionibacterium freudenreichii]
MPKQSNGQKPLQLLTSVPSKDYSRLMVRYPYQTDDQYAHAYHFAAQRLATTFGGELIDDLLLLPFLTLYRQAFELQLKNTIRSLVGLRIRYVEGRTTELLGAVSEERFKNRLGHNLCRLLNETKKHFDALNLPEPFPKSVEGMVAKLDEADHSGTAFRYAGLLPETQEHADFPDLATMLDREFRMLCAAADYPEGLYDSMPTLDEIAGDF